VSNIDEHLEQIEELAELVYSTYVPYSKQRKFHEALNKIRGVFGGNRSGKTDMGCNEARYHATGKYPDWYPETARFPGPTRGRIVVTDYKKGCGEVLEPKIERWFQKGEIIRIERSIGNLSKVHVRHITGGTSTFDVMTHEQNLAQFQGWNGHWCWFDEPPPRDIYIACLRGMVDLDGRMWITATPICEPWMFDEIVLNKERDAFYQFISIYDNPHLTKKAIEEFIVSLRPEEREAMVEGKFLHLTGRIYGEFDTNVHVIDELPDGHESWPVWFVLDPADRRPHHGIWAKADPFNNIYIFDEIVVKATIKDLSKQLIIREITNGVKQESIIRVLDPNKGKTPTAVTGLRLVDEFASHAVYFLTNVNDDIAIGHLAVKERLAYDHKVPVSSTNHPKLYFVKNKTRECVKQLLSYVWDDWRGAKGNGRAEKEVPKDVNKDMPDCVRYLCMSNPRWYPQDGATDEKFNFMGYGVNA
jgi:phage terminase large subunit-like protein